MVTVTPKSRTITNGTANDGSVVEAEMVELYNNDQTLATAVTNIENGSYNPSSPWPIWSIGDIKINAAATVPAGWLNCDGSAVSRTTYANLFTAIGTTWGSGDGSTTFNLPDLRGRIPVGDGTGGGLTARTVGQTGGEEAHALTSAENGPHTHTVTDPGHHHQEQGGSQSFVVEGGGDILGINSGPAWGYSTLESYNTANATTGISINSSGSGTAHNNMQPFAVIRYLIKF